MTPVECSKCRSKMEEGFTLDQTRNAVDTSKWVDGPPEKSFWKGLKTRGKKQIPVTTYRCPRCGYLESYAIERSSAFAHHIR